MGHKLVVWGISAIMVLFVSACSQHEDEVDVTAAEIEIDGYDGYDGTDGYDGMDDYDGVAVGVASLDVASQAYLDQRVGGRVYFSYNQYNIDKAGAVQLKEQAQWLRENSNTNVTIAGNCDARGTREYNLALGARRANTVREFLIAQGIRESRISTVSYGKERPAVVGSNEAAYAANRRSVTIVSP